LADKSTQLVLEALGRAAAEPDGVPLLGAKPALFSASPPARQAAQRCLDEHLLRVIRTETRGKTDQQYCALTEKGLAFLLQQAHPRQVLEDLLRAVEARQQQLDDLLRLARKSQADLEGLKAATERVLQHLTHPTTNGTTPKSADADWTADVLACLTRRHDSAAGDCPLPELFRQAQQTAPALTLGAFHDGLRRLHAQEKIYLHPWTGPLYDLPEPSVALLVGHEIAYYASQRSP
jgi:hypothetical protein